MRARRKPLLISVALKSNLDVFLSFSLDVVSFVTTRKKTFADIIVQILMIIQADTLVKQHINGMSKNNTTHLGRILIRF